MSWFFLPAKSVFSFWHWNIVVPVFDSTLASDMSLWNTFIWMFTLDYCVREWFAPHSHTSSRNVAEQCGVWLNRMTTLHCSYISRVKLLSAWYLHICEFRPCISSAWMGCTIYQISWWVPGSLCCLTAVFPCMKWRRFMFLVPKHNRWYLNGFTELQRVPGLNLLVLICLDFVWLQLLPVCVSCSCSTVQRHVSVTSCRYGCEPWDLGLWKEEEKSLCFYRIITFMSKNKIISPNCDLIFL